MIKPYPCYYFKRNDCVYACMCVCVCVVYCILYYAIHIPMFHNSRIFFLKPRKTNIKNYAHGIIACVTKKGADHLDYR